MSGTSIDPALLAILACPATRTPLRHDPDRNELVSDTAGLAYPIRDGVPVLLVEAARVIDASDRAGAASSPQTKL